jgi:phosphoglycerol transferase MdoB-like AlkP superfamily enzyme
VRLIGLLLAVVVLAIALWLVFVNPRLAVRQNTPVAVAPAAATPVANTMSQNEMADEAAQKAQAAAKAKAAKAKAEALAAEHAAEAAQADAIEQNMTPAQNRINEDYAAQVGDTRPAADAGNASTSPDPSRR